MEVTLHIELGPKTLAFIAGLANTGAAAQTNAPKADAPKADKPAAPAKEDKPKADKPAASDKPKADAKAKKDDAVDFESLDTDAQLEAIKTEVTKHTKKGKSADIKALLSHFDAGRASEVAEDRYAEFYDAVKRYGAGESVEAITGGSDDLV